MRICAVCGKEYEPITLGEYADKIEANFMNTPLKPEDEMEVCMEHATFLYSKCYNCGSLIPAISQVVAHTYLANLVIDYTRVDVAPSNEFMIPLCGVCASDENIAVECEECNRLFLRNESIEGNTVIYTSHNGRRSGFICNGCATHYRACNVCGAFTHDTQGEVTNGGVITCNSCCANTRRRSSRASRMDQRSTSVQVHSYGYKPEPIFYHSENETFKSIKYKLYGVELEVDTNEYFDYDCLASSVVTPVSEVVNKFVEKLYVKTDGSLSPKGLEFVSMPMSVNYHKYNCGWEKAMKKLVSLGYRGHNIEGCGLHVHINKAAFLSDAGMEELYTSKYSVEEDAAISCEHEYSRSSFSSKRIAELDENITKFVFLFEHFWDIMLKFSRRKANLLSYCERYGTPQVQDVKHMKDRVSEDYNRYRSVNVTTSHTVEVRLFRSTLNFNTFIASIQLCDAMVDLARSRTMAELSEMTANDLAKFIYSCNYEELTAVFDKITNNVYSTDTSDSDPNGIEVCEEVVDNDTYDDDSYDDPYDDNDE